MKHPGRYVPRSIATCQLAAFGLGLVFIIVLVFCMGDPGALVARQSSQPVVRVMALRLLQQPLSLPSAGSMKPDRSEQPGPIVHELYGPKCSTRLRLRRLHHPRNVHDRERSGCQQGRSRLRARRPLPPVTRVATCGVGHPGTRGGRLARHRGLRHGEPAGFGERCGYRGRLQRVHHDAERIVPHPHHVQARVWPLLAGALQSRPVEHPAELRRRGLEHLLGRPVLLPDCAARHAKQRKCGSRPFCSFLPPPVTLLAQMHRCQEQGSG